MAIYEVRELITNINNDVINTLLKETFDDPYEAWDYFMNETRKKPQLFTSLAVVKFENLATEGYILQEPTWVVDKMGKVN